MGVSYGRFGENRLANRLFVRSSEETIQRMLAAIYLVTAGVFALDVAIPLGHGIWLLYLFPLWLSSRLILPAAPLRFASVCTVLLAGGLWLAPSGVDVTTVMFSRALGTVMIWGGSLPAVAAA